MACAEDPVTCKQNLEVCVGGCSGTDRGNLPHSFETWIAKSVLSEDVIGAAGYEASYANCTPKTGTVLVELFEGGDSFKTYAARIRVRSGMVSYPRPIRD